MGYTEALLSLQSLFRTEWSYIQFLLNSQKALAWKRPVVCDFLGEPPLSQKIVCGRIEPKQAESRFPLRYLMFVNYICDTQRERVKDRNRDRDR